MNETGMTVTKGGITVKGWQIQPPTLRYGKGRNIVGIIVTPSCYLLTDAMDR